MAVEQKTRSARIGSRRALLAYRAFPMALLAAFACGSEEPGPNANDVTAFPSTPGASGAPPGAAGASATPAPPVNNGGTGSSNSEQLPNQLDPGGAGAPSSSAGSDGSGGAAPPVSNVPPALPPPAPVPVPPDGVVGPSGAEILNFATLREAAEHSGRRIGVAIDLGPLNEQTYRTIAAREFNYATAANEMKWASVQPAPGQFNYGAADTIVNFAQENGLAMKGHTLVWFRQLPNWVQQLNSAATVEDAMLDHIQAVVSQFRGRVISWDVVNEAWNDDGLSMRDLVFQRFLGDGYVDQAFRAARAADPDAKLYYNDFGTEGLDAKSNAVYEMVRGMLERGVPIDGVGLQMHTININGAPTSADLITNIDRLAALGLDVVISELDISTCSAGTTVPERLEAQRLRAYNLVAACVSRPACTEITFWGLTDRYSWLDTNPDISQCENGQAPMGLLFDTNYQAKPAYSAVRSAFRVAR